MHRLISVHVVESNFFNFTWYLLQFHLYVNKADFDLICLQHFNVCRNLPTTVDPPVASVTPVASAAPVTTVAPVTPVGNNCTCVRQDLCGKADHGEDVVDIR